MDLTPALPDLLTAARVGLDPGDSGLAVDPAGAKTLAVIEGGGTLAVEMTSALAHVLRELDTPAVLLLRSRSGRPSPRDRAAWRDISDLVDERLLPTRWSSATRRRGRCATSGGWSNRPARGSGSGLAPGLRESAR